MNNGHGLRLLLADDEEAVQKLYDSQLLDHMDNSASSQISELESELFNEPIEADNSGSTSVTVCSQGVEAVDLTTQAIEAGTPFDVIVLDVRMPPGINGIEAAELIRDVDTTVPIIFLSGYSDVPKKEIDKRIPPPNRVHFISKPIRMAQLAEKIRDVLVD